MSHSTIAILILLITIVLYALEKPPLAVTSILAAIAMAFTGCIPFASALKGFSNTAVVMLIGLSIVGEAFFTTGLTDRVGDFFLRRKQIKESTVVAIIFVAGALISALLNGLIVIAVFMSIIDTLATSTNNRISRKNCYLPTAIAAVFGGNLSAIGSTSMINASAQLGESYFGRPFHLCEPFLIGLPACAISLLILVVTGTRLQERFFDFKETCMAKAAKAEVPYEFPEVNPKTFSDGCKSVSGCTPRMLLVIIALLLCLVAFAIGMDYGVVSMLAACILIATGCIDLDRAMQCVSWQTVFVVAGTLGISEGISASGAGLLIAETILDVLGFLADVPVAICIIFLFLATLISNFMSNNATVGILMPIALATCQSLGSDPVAFALAIAVGANLSVMTPICTSAIAITAVCGYRFKDYARFGGIFNILAFIGTAVMLMIVYF